MQEELTFSRLYQLLKKYLFSIILTVILGAGTSLAGMYFFVTPLYSSDAQLLVNQRQTTDAPIQYNEIQSNIQLISTYSDIIKGHAVLDQVSQNLDGTYTIDELEESISVMQSPESQVFYLSAVNESPTQAQIIVNEVITVLDSTLSEIYNDAETSINVISPATWNGRSVSPNPLLFIAIGAAVGLLFSLTRIFIVELMDTTLRDDEFLAQLGFTNLGQIYELSNKELKNSRLVSNKKKKWLRERV
ncbi:YveK family protein [Ruoffia sp. FAM 24228]|uniref:YveK family protein n=1 Tax=Ruoffia sp. FAM 24228 TaxID=3259517 RepID=UPI003887CBA6